MSSLFSKFFLLLMLWSCMFCYYIPLEGLCSVNYSDVLGSFFIAGIVFTFTLLQMPDGARQLASRTGYIALSILSIPLASYTILGHSLNLLLFICAAMPFTVFAIFVPRIKTSVVERWCSCLLYAATSILFVYSATKLTPYFDSWQVYAMAQSYSGDFYYMDYIRQNFLLNHYGMAFPYLGTLLLFLVDLCSQWNTSSYLILNFAAVLLMLYLIRRIFYLYSAYDRWPIAGMLCLLHFYSTHELQGGGTTILTLCIILLLTYILLANRNHSLQLLRYRYACILGALLAAGLMIRFDFVAFAGSAMLLYMIYAFRHKQYLSILMACSCFFIVIAPWIIYSATHFDAFFITDNSRRIINIPDTRPSSYFSPDSPAQTLFSHPSIWFKNILFQIYLMGVELAHCLLRAQYTIILMISLIVLALKDRSTFFIKSKTNRVSFALFFCSLSAVILLILVHYFDNMRYYAPHLCLLIVLALIMLRRIPMKPFIVLSTILLASALYFNHQSGLINKGFVKHLLLSSVHPQSCREHITQLTPRAKQVQEYIREINPDAMLCCSFVHKINTPRFAHQSGFRFTALPSNLSTAKQLMHYLREFEIDFLYHEENTNHFYITSGMTFIDDCISLNILSSPPAHGSYKANRETINTILSSKHIN